MAFVCVSFFGTCRHFLLGKGREKTFCSLGSHLKSARRLGVLTAACQAAKATAQGQEKQLQTRAGPCPQSCLHRKGGLGSAWSSGLLPSLLGSRDDRAH